MVNRTGTSPHGISGVVDLVDQQFLATTTPEMPCGNLPVLFTTWHLWVFSSASEVRNLTKHKWFTYSVQDFQHNFSKR